MVATGITADAARSEVRTAKARSTRRAWPRQLVDRGQRHCQRSRFSILHQ